MASGDNSKQLLICVLGMHRSGTSLLAKAAEVVGADLGDNLMLPQPDNPKGFWEDMDVFEINSALLENLDVRWDIPTVLPLTDFRSPDLAELYARATAFLAKRMTRSRLVAMKDPRLSLLLPFWLTVAGNMAVQVRFVVSVRNPIDVASSLAERNGFDMRKGLLLWVNHYYLTLRHLLEQLAEPLFVEYGQLLTHPMQEVRRLARFVGDGIEVEARNDKVSWFVEEFVDKTLCHSASTVEAVRQVDEGVAGLWNIYTCCRDFCNSGWSSEKAGELLRKIDPLSLEAENYRHQLHFFKDELAAKLRVQAEEPERKKEAEVQWLQQQCQQKDQELDAFALRMAEEVADLAAQKDQEIDRLRSSYEKENRELHAAYERKLRELTAIQQQTDRHLQGAMTRIEDIRESLSYRLGMGLTWPARRIYDTLLYPAAKQPGRLGLALQMIFLIIRHPKNALRLLSWERIRNVYITFIQKPGTARGVVDYYSRLLHGSPLASHGGSVPRYGDRDLGAVEDFAGSRRVSVVIVNYNGRPHLPGLLASLRRQTYDDLEIILVDNGSSDGSVEYICSHFPEVKTVSLPENVGFSEANNVGAEVATGAYLCLVNNDMCADRNLLQELFKAIEESPTIGAVGPKILFWKPFATIELTASTNAPILLDTSALEESAPVYAKWFFAEGWAAEQISDGKRCTSFKRAAKLRFAICDGQTLLKLRLRSSSDADSVVDVTASPLDGAARCELSGNEWSQVTLDFTGRADAPELRYLINNAGSEASGLGEVRDRGFGEPDEGQYARKEPVTSLCGGAMLVRRTALRGKPVFAGAFFAYYEDTELSLRLREGGYDLVYNPKGIIYHKHASTSQENSAFFRFYVNRNRILFLALHYPPELWRLQLERSKADLTHQRTYYLSHPSTPEEQQFAERVPEILNDWQALIPRIEAGAFLSRDKRFPTIAVYNTFWDTFGGGEHHACVLAEVLQKLGPVDLISENEFSVRGLERQFGVDLKFCQKRLVTPEHLHYDKEATAQYDIFVNSTYGSDLISASRRSYYIVSFPYQLDDRPSGAREFLGAYSAFLANSNYTAGWVKRWWGVDCEVLHPSIAMPPAAASERKEERILNVGRFFRDGHNKKQLEMVEVFRGLKDTGALDERWRLTLVGQVHRDQIAYLEQVRDLAEGYPIDFHIDVPLADLQELYRKSAIYWHATGLNEDLNKHPELFEHFGISTVEAMAYGCVPIVIKAAGQTEIIEHQKSGFLFADEDELISYTQYCADLFMRNHEAFAQLSSAAIERSGLFSRSAVRERFLSILDAGGFKVSGDALL